MIGVAFRLLLAVIVLGLYGLLYIAINPELLVRVLQWLVN